MGIAAFSFMLMDYGYPLCPLQRSEKEEGDEFS